METDGANPASGSDSATVSDPVDLISGLLDRESNPPAPQKPRNQQPEPEPDEAKDPPEPGPEDPPEEEGEDDEDEQQQEEPAAEKYTVKVDGKEVEVTRDELLNGYQRQADYTRKTMEAAAIRQAAEQESQRVQAERAHYAQQLDQVAVVLQSTLPPPPNPADIQADPISYMQQKELYEQRVTQLQQVLGERDRAQQQTQQQMQAHQQQMLTRAREQLLEALPEWREPEKAKKQQREVAEHLRTIGYADHEISAAADPRAIVMARESMLYRQLMASKPQVQQRVAVAPKMVRPGASGPAPDKSKAITQQIRRSGGKDLDAVARLIELG